MLYTGELVTELSDITMEALVKPLVAACRQSRSSAGSDSAGEGGETASAIAHQNVLPAWQFYAYQLVPSFVLGMGLNIFLSAYIYTQTERCSAEALAGCGHPGGLPFGDAVWHTWVTATTVGYGDLDLTTKSSRLWASFHILMSVSWLASLVSQCQSAYQTRQWDLQRAVSYRVQLMPELIDALETPEAKAESRGVNETEFVLGMLIAMGAEVLGEKLAYDVHVKPLITRFRCLDWDHSGELTRDDLAFMIEKANKAQSALNEDEELDPDGQRRGSATAAEAAINVIEAATGLDIDGDGDVGISGHLMQTHQLQRVTVTEAAINVIEAATGLDIDGDGDVGISGHPMQTHQVQKVEDY